MLEQFRLKYTKNQIIFTNEKKKDSNLLYLFEVFSQIYRCLQMKQPKQNKQMAAVIINKLEELLNLIPCQ